MSAGVIICYAKCWPCQFGSHFDPPKAHTWMDDEDRDHALETGQITPETNLAKERLCGCWCAAETGPAGDAA